MTAIVAPLCAPTASAQTTPTVTLSVPANTEFAEGEGNTSVTVTATLSAARSANTVVDLSLGGTAKSTDYTVVTLPDITITAGQTVGTADLILRPVDDAFFEGEETVRIGGSAGGVTVNAVDVALADDETTPTLNVSVTLLDGTPYRVAEGSSGSRRITVSLVGATFEADETVSLAPQYNSSFTSADIDYGANTPPWSLTIPAGRVSAQMNLSFTVEDDELAEEREVNRLRATVTVAGTTIRSVPDPFFIAIEASDLPLSFDVQCHPVESAYAGDNISCWPVVSEGSTDRAYTVTMNWVDAHDDPITLVTPASKAFTVGSGSTGPLRNMAASFSLDAGSVGMRLFYLITVSPNDQQETVPANSQSFRVYPVADPSYTITGFRRFHYWPGVSIPLSRAFVFSFSPTATRPVEPNGPANRIEVVLDSGVVSVPCRGISRGIIECEYYIQDGDFDFDGRIELAAGAVKFNSWRDRRDPTVTGSVASPLPAEKTTYEMPGTLIYGGSTAIDLSVSPQTVQEGTGEQALTIIAVNRAGSAAGADLVIPLTFTDISTSAGDYSVRGPLSVTIPRGQVEGRTTAVLFTPTDDLRREDRLETVRIEGSKGAMMTPFVRGADLNILDAAGIALSVSPARISEDGAATQVRVTAAWGDTADSTLARDLEVALAWGGTAGPGDYARAGGATVTIPANARSGTTTVTITPTDDNLLEGDETIVIGGSAAGRPVVSAELTLADDETVPAVTLSVDTAAVSESGAAVSVTVSAELDPEVAMANDVTTVTLELGGTATAGTDYSATWSPASRQIAIPRESTLGSNTVTLTLTPTDDSVAEGDETVVVQGTATTDRASRNLVVKVATIALEDDDTLGVNLSPKTLTVEEGATDTYEVWLGAQPTGDVTVTLSSTDATTATVDKNELTFTSTTWNTRQTVTLTGQDDDRNNADDRRTASIRHTASGGGYDDLAAVVLPVTVTDDDEAASFSIGDASATEGQTASFTVARRGATGDAATVAWSTAEDADGDHPASSADYTAQIAAQMLSFAGGETSKTITVRTAQDTLDEDDETFLVVLSSPSTGTSIADGTATGTIIDDDATTAELSIAAPAAVSEGAADDTATMSFAVNLSAASGRRVTVDYADAGSGTATSGTDYSSVTAGTLTFAAGETSKTVAVTVNGDDVDEDNETVTLRLSSPVNAGFAAGAMTLEATGTITDDDTRGVTVSAASGGVSVAEADDSRTSGTTENEASYTVALTSEPTGTVTIELESGNTRVATVSPSSLEFTASDWGAKTVTVTGVSDDVDNANDRRTTSITHTVDAMGTDYEDETAPGVPVTVTDDEATPTVALSLDPASIAESGNGNASTVTAALDRASHATVTVMVSVPDGAPVTQTGTTLTIAAGATASTGTVTLTAVDNNVDAPAAAVTVSGDADGGGVADPADVTLAITDDDAAPTGITLTTDTPTIAEDAATKTVKVTATVNGDTTYATDTTVQVMVGASNDSAISGTDYAAVTAFDIDIDAGEMSGEKTFRLDATDDAIDEDSESISVSGTSGTLTVTGTNIALTDNDTRGVTVTGGPLMLAEADTSGTPAEEHKATYTVVLTSEPTDDVTINIGVPEGAPFTVSDTGLDFTPSTWSTAQTVTVTAVDDNVDNTGDMRRAVISHTVDADDTDYEDETAPDVTVTVTDDDAAPTALTLTVDADTETDNVQTSVSEGGGAKTVRVTATLDGSTTFATDKTVTVEVGHADDGATEGTDYAMVGTQSITIAAGASSGHVDFTLTPTDDAVDEESETISFKGTAAGLTVADAEITLTDDDTKGVTVSVASAGLTVRETDDGGTTETTENVATYTVVLASQPTGDVVIDVEVPAGAPFTASPSSLTFTPGGAGIWSTAQVVTVTAVDDNVDNTGNARSASITHALTVGSSDYGGVSVPGVTVTVTDDDAAPTALTLTVDADTETDNVQASVSEGGGAKTVRVTATLDGSTTFATDKAVTVEVGKSSDGAAEGTDYAMVGTQTITIKAGASSGYKDFTLTPTDDAIDEESETISLDGTLAGVTVADAEITLTDDDDTPGGIALSVDTDSVTADSQTEVGEAAGATTVTVTAAVTGGTTYSGAQTVAVSVSGDTATVTDDFAAVTGFSITIPAGTASARGMFTLTPVADAIDENDETVDVTGTVSGDGAPSVTGATITIKDDDTKGVTVSAASAGLTIRETDDGGTTETTENEATYTVVLTSEPTGDVVIDVEVPGGAPFTASPSRLTFTPGGAGIWSTAQRVAVTAVDDNVDNTGNRRSASITHALTVGSSDYGGVSVPGVTVTVTDDDAAPTALTLTVDADTETDNVQASVSEGGGAKTVRVTATLGGSTTFATDKAVTVEVGHADDGATEGTDYANVGRQEIEIAAGASSGHVDFTLTPANDDVDEENETISFKGTAAGLTVADAEITLTDDDTKGVTVSAASAGLTVRETDDAGTTETTENVATYTVVLASQPTDDVAIDLSLPEGAPFTASPSRLTFTPSGAGLWSTAQRVTVTAVDDNVDNTGNQRNASITHALTVGRSDYGGVSVPDVTVTVTDDDAAPTALTLTVDADTETDNVQSSVSEGGGAKTVRVTATLDGSTTFAVDKTVTVDVGHADDSAAEGTDYAMVVTQTITLKAGASSGYKDFTLTLTADSLHEGSETISVEGALSGVTVAGAEITLTDDDAAPTALTLTVDADTGTNNVQNSLAEGGGAKTVRVTATLGGSSTFVEDKTVTVEVGHADDSATEGTDYAMVATQTITLKAGASSGHVDFTLTPTDDAVDEESETISFKGTAAGLTVADATITLTDDDTKGVTVSAASAGLTLRETDDGGTTETTENEATYTVVLASEPTDDVVIDVEVPAGAPFTASPSRLTFTPGGAGIWSTAQVVTVTAVDDNVDNTGNQRSASITHSLTVGNSDYGGVSVPDVTVTVTDDDAAPTALTLTVDADTATNNVQTSVSEGGGAKTVRVTATLDGSTTFATDKTVTVEVGKSSDSATEGTDYARVATQSITLKAGTSSGHADFTLTPTDDAVDEENETISLDGTLAGVTVTDAEITLTDDDDAPGGIALSVDTDSVMAGSQTEVGEAAGATTVTVTATVTGGTTYSGAQTVAVSVSGDTATVADDFAAVTGFDITIPAGTASARGAFTLTPVADAVDEDDETVDVTGTVAGDGAPAVAGAAITIKDDDTKGVTVSAASAGLTLRETDDGGTMETTENEAAYTVVLASEPTDDVVIDVEVPAGAPFTASPSSLTFTPGGAGIWSTAQVVTVTAVDDNVDNTGNARSASITHALTVGRSDYGGVSVPDVAVTVTDDDGAPGGIALSVDTDSVMGGEQTNVGEAAGATTVQVTATVTGGTTYGVAQTVAIAVSGGTATVTDDFTAVTGFNIAIPAGATARAGTFSLTPVNDLIHEANESINVTGAVSGAGAPTVSAAAVTITDDDPAPTGLTLTVDADTDTPAAQMSVSEGGGAKTVRVTAMFDGSTTFATDKTVAVEVGKNGDSATEGAGGDYGTVARQDITIKAGASSGHVDFTLTPTDDLLFEGDETISLDGTLAGVTVTDAEITLTDDETVPAVTLLVDPDAVSESGGTRAVTVSAVLDPTVAMANDTTTVTLSLGGTATAGTDYTSSWSPSTPAITFPVGETKGANTVTLTLTPTDDSGAEDDETVVIQGAATTQSRSLVVKVAVITLEDDDAPGVNLSPRSLTVTEGAAATYDVWLGTQPSQDVTVTLSGLDATMATADRGSLTFTQTTWNIRQQVTVSGEEDDLDNAGDKRVTSIRHSAAGGGYDNVDDAVLNVTVADNDDAPSFSIGDASAAEGDAVTFTVNRAGAKGAAATVSWQTADDTDGSHPASTADYTAQATAQVLNFAVGDTSKTLTVQTTEDMLHEENETFLVKLSAPSAGASIDDGTATGTITDDDGAPTTATLTVDADTGTQNIQNSLAEGGGAKTVRVTATMGGSVTFTEDKTVTVEVGHAGDTATEGTDYQTVGPQSITITAGSSTGHVDFTLTPTQDQLAEGGETISFKGTAAGLTVADAEITLTDDDSAPTTATLTVDADTGTGGTQNSLAEDGGAKTVRVTATLGGTVSFTADKTVTVEVGHAGDTATEGTDYQTVGPQSITITAGSSSGYKDFTLTPTQDQLAEGGETISFKGTADGLTVADATITLTDDDSAPTTATLTVDADTGTQNIQNSLAEDGGAKTVRVTAALGGSVTFTADTTVTVEVGNTGDTAVEGTDYATVEPQTVTIKAGASSGHADFTLTPTQDQLAEDDETISFKGTADGLTVADATITLTDDDSAPTTTTLTVDADTGTQNTQNSLAEGGGAKTVRVTATLDGSTTFAVDKTVTVEVGHADDSATEGTDYAMVGTQSITITAGTSSGQVDFTLTPTADLLHEGDETISVEGALSGVSVTGATITITDDDAARMITVLLSASDYEVFEGESLTVKVNLSESRAADTVIALDPATRTGQTATRGVDYDGSMRTVTILAGETSGTARISTTADDRKDPNETFTAAIQESGLSSDVILGEPHTAVVTIRERVTGVTPPATATVEYKGSDSRITLTVPADLQGNGIDVAFRYGTDKGTARSGGFQCGDDDDADLINREVVGSGTPGEVINRPTLRRMMDLDADTVDLEIELCPGSRGKTFDVIWDTTLYLGNPDRGFPGIRSAPFDAAAAHCSSASLCRTRVTIEGGNAVEACVSHSLRETVEFHAGEAHHGDAHVDRWKQVLAAFGDDNGYTPMTGTEAQQNADQFSASRWNPVVTALQCLEAAPVAEDASDQAGPEITVAAGGDIAEGADAVFTVHADPAPASDLTVALAIADDTASDFLAENDEGPKTVTIKVGESAAAYTLTTVDDDVEEADGSVSAMIEAGTGYRVGTPSKVVVAVSDDDDPAPVAPVVNIAGGAGVTEGAPASFTVAANPAPGTPLTVALTIDQSGDYAATGETGVREIVVPTEGSMTFEVATVNDTADEPDGSVTATLAAGAGYAVAASPDDAASVAVADDDVAAAGVPTLSVNDVEVQEGSYRRVEFTVTLSEASDRYVSFYYRTRESSPVSAKLNRDFWASTGKSFAGIRPGVTEYRIIAATVIDDSYDEDPETFEVVLSDAHGAAIADGVGVATIVNDDPMPAAFLSRFGRTVAEQALDGIAGRIAAPREAGAQGTLAGQALSFGTGSRADGTANDAGSLSMAANDNTPGGSVSRGVSLAQSDVARAFGASADRFSGGHGPDHVRGLGESRTMTGLEALLGSSFTATGEKDGTGGSLAFWGRAAQSRFDGREGTFSLDGETTTAMLGADYARGKWLVGLALMQSSGEGGYADAGTGSVRCPQDLDAETRAVLCTGAVREGDGDVEASLTAVVPYAAIQASERLRLWGAAGFGTGEVTLKPDVGGSLKSDISWTMAAAGARSELLAPPDPGSGSGTGIGSGPALALTASALWARTSSEKTHELAASDSDVTRLRLGLEGGYAIAMEGGGSLMPKVEIGARHDGGDAETGSGFEIGGGIAWTDPAIGLSLDLSGRTLIAHGNDDLEDRGFAASLAFDPNPGTERGLSLTLSQDWGGSAQGGLDALFATDPLADRAGTAEATSRRQAEAAYGFPAFSGRFTGSPHVGLGLATGARDYSLGWRLSPAANANTPDLSFGVKATRRESDTAAAEHIVGFELRARW